ncbi:MAG: radical SAM protein [Acidobacteriota bacterium]
MGAVVKPRAKPESALGPPRVELKSLDTLWFQVAGTVCNLACSHCFISCSPTNHTHELLSLAEVEVHLDDALRLGIREYYFTGGEPFLNPDMEAILERTLRQGPANVLTNGLLLDDSRCERLAALAAASEYSLDLRISLDGYDAESNDPIRGEGTFERILDGALHTYRAGLNPVMTVTEVHPENASREGRNRFLELLRERGIERPRLKMMPVLQLGAEAERSGAYASWQQLQADAGGDDGWDHLQCSSCRMVTDQGVWVCPILVNEPEGRMGDRLADTLESYPLGHSACWTCHVHGLSCRT